MEWDRFSLERAGPWLKVAERFTVQTLNPRPAVILSLQITQRTEEGKAKFTYQLSEKLQVPRQMSGGSKA